ncbi:MAG: hypothetical protein GMKNLPBB_00449 [Myxococcota bacterium]|nr:hypothetical protein [Myxococcota bacterium]
MSDPRKSDSDSEAAAREDARNGEVSSPGVPAGKEPRPESGLLAAEAANSGSAPPEDSRLETEIPARGAPPAPPPMGKPFFPAPPPFADYLRTAWREFIRQWPAAVILLVVEITADILALTPPLAAVFSLVLAVQGGGVQGAQAALLGLLNPSTLLAGAIAWAGLLLMLDTLRLWLQLGVLNTMGRNLARNQTFEMDGFAHNLAELVRRFPGYWLTGLVLRSLPLLALLAGVVFPLIGGVKYLAAPVMDESGLRIAGAGLLIVLLAGMGFAILTAVLSAVLREMMMIIGAAGGLPAGAALRRTIEFLRVHTVSWVMVIAHGVLLMAGFWVAASLLSGMMNGLVWPGRLYEVESGLSFSLSMWMMLCSGLVRIYITLLMMTVARGKMEGVEPFAGEVIEGRVLRVGSPDAAPSS